MWEYCISGLYKDHIPVFTNYSEPVRKVVLRFRVSGWGVLGVGVTVYALGFYSSGLKAWGYMRYLQVCVELGWIWEHLGERLFQKRNEYVQGSGLCSSGVTLRRLIGVVQGHK